MNKRITGAFAQGKAFIPFITCGDPSLEVTEQLVYAMEEAGADLICKQYGMDLISLIAPTSHERIARIAREAEGFVYCVSSLGVTGTRSRITTDIGAMVKLVKQEKDIPCAVGFGISTPEQAKKMAEQSDGAIVGSAIVKLCATHGENCVPYVKEYVQSMKSAVRNAKI